MKRPAICNLLAAVFSLLVVVPFVMMLTDRQLPIKLEYGEITPSYVMSNETVEVRWRATKVRKFGDGIFDCQGTVQRRFIDSEGYTTLSEEFPIQSYRLMGEAESAAFTKSLVIPMMQTGAATYQVITRYWCNPVQKYLLPITNYEEKVNFFVVGAKSLGRIDKSEK